jgi:hypothetical protein
MITMIHNICLSPSLLKMIVCSRNISIIFLNISFLLLIYNFIANDWSSYSSDISRRIDPFSIIFGLNSCYKLQYSYKLKLLKTV